MIRKYMDLITITNSAYFFIFLGGIAAIVLSIIQARGATEDKNEIISKQEQKIKELESTLKEKIKFIESYISGGDSYPELEILSLPNNSKQVGKMFFQMANNFDLPIYDIKVEMYDYDFIKLKTFKGLGNLNYIKPSDFEKARILGFQDATLSPRTMKGGIYSPEAKECNFYAKLFTRNKVIIEKITVMNDKGLYYLAYELIDDSTSQTLKKIYSPGISEKTKDILNKRLIKIPINMEIKFSE
jgi:hypothetical protein